jgi:hypothetical protein
MQREPILFQNLKYPPGVWMGPLPLTRRDFNLKIVFAHLAPCGTGEAMNTIAKVALIAIIALFTFLLMWGLWTQ